MKKRNILGLDEQELISLSVSLGEQPFRGKQLFRQIYNRKVYRFDQMTDLAKSFRSKLEACCQIVLPEVERCSRSQDGTVKFLMRLSDGQRIETVFIPEDGRDTLCISSQVGCNIGCTFCLTAQMGFQRNLAAGEIVGQILRIIDDGLLDEKGFNIVFMGMGEPLYNYRNVMKAFRVMTAAQGMDLSYRKITISTSGVVPLLRKMAGETILPNLAISLNATLSRTRDAIMPINKTWDLSELLEVCRSFPLEPRRRITIEYVLLRQENDSAEDARRLARLLRGIPAKVNLIPYNPNPRLPHRRPTPKQVEEFQKVLQSLNVPAFVRKTRGLDVSAACGQLAYSERTPALESAGP
jgi:23S rRNA (adenine2503-C2)-methyltransferase